MVAPGIVRPDAWTATEAREEAERLRREWNLDLREAEIRASGKRPPPPTQARIIALEAGVQNLHRFHGETWRPGASHFAASKIPD